MDQMSAAAAEPMMQSPLYAAYKAVAPRVEDWPVLIGKISEALKVDFDWGADIAKITARTLLVYADADSIRPAHIVEFFGLLGGGLRDAGWDSSSQPTNQLAVLPGRSHYDVYLSPALPPVVVSFLDAEPR
jgi:pimeloyl-ACP methyl ester carboxylesterase